MRRCEDSLDLKVITGKLIRSEYEAEIEVIFCPSQLKIIQPIVFCYEPWVRHEMDWHCLPYLKEGSLWNGYYNLCWIYPGEWILAHNYKSKRLKKVAIEGSELLKNNLSKLLDCHWVGHALGIKKWRDEWGAWGHGRKGIQEFSQEIEARGMPNNWDLVNPGIL